MQIGYARVSTGYRDNAVQVTALKTAGCERIYREKASGGRWDRPELHRLLDQLRKGDVLNALSILAPVVWKLDRLSRSLRDVLTKKADGSAFRVKADSAKRGLLTCFRRFWPESRGLSPFAPHHTLRNAASPIG